MWKKIISVLLLLNFTTAAAFAHTAPIESGGENKYKAVRLTPEIYNNANPGLSDILIKDSKGESVPYFINSSLQDAHENRNAYPMQLINSYTKDDSFYFDYELAAASDSDIIATSIEISTGNTNFAKPVDVYGSYDDINWEFVQGDSLYSIDGKAKLDIEFSKPQKYTNYRFRLANNLEKISFDSVDLIYSVEISEKTYFIESLTPEFSIEDKDKKTYITIEGLKNLNLCEVTIKTRSMFKRVASTAFGISKEIYNLSLNGESYTDTTIPLDRRISQDKAFIITIANNDDKPIDITGITVSYYADELVFEGTADGNYTLEFGADISKTAPVYDIASYKDEILKGEIDALAIGAVSYDEIGVAMPEPDYKVMFNIVVVAVALFLGGLILLRLKRRE